MIHIHHLTEAEFEDQFPLRINHLNPWAIWSYDNDPGCLFETYGEEFEFVRSQDRRYVWTLVEGDDGQIVILSGLWMVNRLGYFISKVPVPDHHSYQVLVETTENEGE